MMSLKWASARVNSAHSFPAFSLNRDDQPLISRERGCAIVGRFEDHVDGLSRLRVIRHGKGSFQRRCV